jgi:hypothetical protein
MMLAPIMLAALLRTSPSAIAREAMVVTPQDSRLPL